MPFGNYKGIKQYEIAFVIDTELPIQDIATYLDRSYFSVSQIMYRLRKLGYDVRKKRRSNASSA